MSVENIKNNVVRVASFNIGDFTTATESAENHIMYGSGTPKTLEEYTKVFEKAGADIWGLQEDSEFFFYPEKILPYDALYKNILPSYKREFSGAYNGKAFLSRFEICDVAPVYYPTAVTSYAPQGTKKYGHPWFLTGKVIVGDKTVSVVSLHFDWQCKERRATQIEAVIDFAKKQEYCIIIGDFNPENRINGEAQADNDSVVPGSINMYKSDWKRFADAELENVNGGKFGPFGTIMKGGAPKHPYPWDNIVVTLNIKILNAEALYEPWMNDHAILVADLEIN